MLPTPYCPADITELISTLAGHMVAALILLNDELALCTLTVVQITLKKLHLSLVAFTFVLGQQAFPTKM